MGVLVSHAQRSEGVIAPCAYGAGILPVKQVGNVITSFASLKNLMNTRVKTAVRRRMGVGNRTLLAPTRICGRDTCAPKVPLSTTS